MSVAMLERRFVLDLPVDPLPLGEAVARVVETITAHRQGEVKSLQIVTMNAEMAMQAQTNPALGAVIRNAGLVVPDGSGVVWAVRRQPGAPAVAKLAGVDLLQAIAAEAARHNWGIYFLGAKPGVAQEAADRLLADHPGMRVVGVRDGYFQPEDEPALVAAIRETRPDILLVALGVPRQETWIAQHQAKLGVAIAMGVGGSFDVFAGRVKRAPVMFRRLNLEWLYRLIQEPWRFSRMWGTLPIFVKEVLTRGDAPHPASEVQS